MNRVRIEESRGQTRQGEDMEELAAEAEEQHHHQEQHLDDDVEVLAHKTGLIEDVVGEAARCSARANEYLA